MNGSAETEFSEVGLVKLSQHPTIVSRRLINNSELQIRPRDIDDDVSSVFLESHPPVLVAVWSTDRLKVDSNFEI